MGKGDVILWQEHTAHRKIMAVLLFPNKMSFIVYAPLFRNFSIFNADNAVRKLGNFVIVGNHYKGLAELLAGSFQKSQNIVTRPAIQNCRSVHRPEQ